MLCNRRMSAAPQQLAALPGAYVEVSFAEPDTTSADALAYLRRTASPPHGHAWNEAKLHEQRIGTEGAFFRFVFPARSAVG